MPAPTIGVEPDGHITFEWYRDPGRVLSVSIGPDGDLHYAALLGGVSRVNGTEPFFRDVPKEIGEAVRRLFPQ